jgi:hypothetical protein
MLIANLITSDGKATFLKFDVPYLVDGKTQPDFSGIQTLGEPFTTGKLLGSPARYDMAVGKGMYYFLTLVEDSLGERGVAVVNFRDGKVDAFIGLSNLYTPISMAQGAAMIHVLVKDSSDTGAFGSKILRLPMVNGNYLMTGGVENGNYVIEPQDTEVSYTYNSRDGITNVNGNPETLAQVLNMSKQINDNNDIELMGTEIKPNDLEVRPLATGYHISSKSVRDQSVEEQELTAYLEKVTLPITTLTIPEGLKVYKLDCYANVLVETAYELDSDGITDPTKSLFRAFHASHYDFLSDGGWSFGCEGDLVTDGITPIDSCIDNLVYKGTLKAPPDLGPILIDYKTGRALYRFPKPVMLYTAYGDFVTVKLADSNKVIRTSCSDVQDNIATTLDGIARPDKVAVRDEAGNPVYAFSIKHALEVDSDYDESINLFNRAVLPVAKYAQMQLWHESWHKGDPDKLPEWVSNDLTSPVSSIANMRVFQKRKVPSNVFYPTITAGASGGYYYLNLIKEKSTVYEEYSQDVQEIDDQIAALQAQEQTPAIEAQIAALEAEKTVILNEMLALDPETNGDLWITPRNILRKIYQIEPRHTQAIDPITGDPYITGYSWDYSGSDTKEDCWARVPIRSLSSGTVVDTTDSGIIVDPGVRSWVNLYIQMGVDPDDQSTGVSYYSNDEYTQTGLGKKVGANDQMHHPETADVFGKYPGSMYEAGWQAESATYQWKVGISCFGENGLPVPHMEIDTEEEINDTAPTEVKGDLLETRNIRKTYTDGGWYKGYVLNSLNKITRVEVTVTLMNLASQTFIWGYRTIQVAHPTSHTCPGPDPGYFAGTNCEGAACGNVECTSWIFGGNYSLYPDRPRLDTQQKVLEAQAILKLDADPFAQNDFEVGSYIVGNIDVRLNDVMNAYRINIGQDQR